MPVCSYRPADTAFVSSRGGWMYCDDSSIKSVDAKQVVVSFFCSSCFLFAILRTHAHHALSQHTESESICSILQKGSSIDYIYYFYLSDSSLFSSGQIYSPAIVVNPVF